MMFARGTATFYALRFLLGAAEGGFFPGIVFYLAGFFPANYRARAVSRFMLAIPVANVLSGLLAGPLLGLQGTFGLAGWQWLFLLEGLPAALLGVLVLLVLPDAPADARWLSLPHRAALERRLLAERHETHRHGVAGSRAALISARVWQLGLIWGAMYLVANGYTFWAPQLIQHSFGRSAAWTGNVLAAISLAGGVAMFLSGSHSDRTGERQLHIAVPFGLRAIAWLLVASPLPPIWRLAGLALAAISIPCLCGPFWCVPSTFLSGEAAAGGLALISSVGALGGFVGPNVLGIAQRVTGSQQGGFMVLAGVAALGGVMALLLKNVQRPARWPSGDTFDWCPRREQYGIWCRPPHSIASVQHRDRRARAGAGAHHRWAAFMASEQLRGRPTARHVPEKHKRPHIISDAEQVHFVNDDSCCNSLTSSLAR